MPGASKTRVRKKFSRIDLDDISGDPEEWITELELLRVNLPSLGVVIDDVKIMTHIVTNLPEENQNILENIEEYLYDNIDTLTIKRICGKLSPKYDQMDVR